MEMEERSPGSGSLRRPFLCHVFAGLQSKAKTEFLDFSLLTICKFSAATWTDMYYVTTLELKNHSIIPHVDGMLYS